MEEIIIQLWSRQQTDLENDHPKGFATGIKQFLCHYEVRKNFQNDVSGLRIIRISFISSKSHYRKFYLGHQNSESRLMV